MKVLIVDDHKIFGEGLASILESIQIKSIRVFQDPKKALDHLNKFKDIDLVFTDINMPEFNGFKMCEELRLKHKKIKTIVMSMYDDTRIKQQALKSGADIYLTKTATKEEISLAIKNCFNNKKHIYKTKKSSTIDDNFTIKYKLTSRERQIITEILDEKSNKEIAETLKISKRTVESHRKNIALKLDVKNSIGIAKIAIKYNLVK
jgi:DNA-binding NarL/FixJ family response regulator